jgi:transcriptional regulator with XRE-family HTH domain
VAPEDVKRLRQELGYSVRKLAQKLGIDHDELEAWERGERFPTRKHVANLEALRLSHGEQPARPLTGGAGTDRLADPMFWLVVQKLALHDELYREVARLAEDYPDPKASEQA